MKIAFITLGCKINQYETEAMRRDLLGPGYEEVDPASAADVYIVNTCSVTATAGAKSRRQVLRAARRYPSSRIVVVGCSTAAERERIARIPQVALVAGNREKSLVSSYLRGQWRPGEEPPAAAKDLMEMDVDGWSDRTRATVKVQDGCSNFCSFCVIPRLRGLSRSRPASAVVEEVRRLKDAGYREIVVSGVHLQEYGLDLDPPLSLPVLLQRIARVGDGLRIRLSSLGARAFTEELLDVLDDPAFCRHWHVPIQAGSDEVLQRMRRGYTVDDFRRAIAALRQRHAEPAITTDVIVGHPGETGHVFEQSLDLYRELDFARMHVFPFSAREGTLASRFRDRIPGGEIRRRAALVGEVEVEMRRSYQRRFVGTTEEILVEGAGRARREGWLEGLTDRYQRVRCPIRRQPPVETLVGSALRVRLLEEDAEGLRGEVLDPSPGGEARPRLTSQPRSRGAIRDSTKKQLGRGA